MGGTYGLARDRFWTSLRAGRGLLRRLRDGDIDIGATECGACRIQMEQGVTKRTLAPDQAPQLGLRSEPLAAPALQGPQTASRHVVRPTTGARAHQAFWLPANPRDRRDLVTRKRSAECGASLEGVSGVSPGDSRFNISNASAPVRRRSSTPRRKLKVACSRDKEMSEAARR